MYFVKSETLYLSENELNTILKTMELLEAVEDRASSPETRQVASNANNALYLFYQSDFCQPAETDPDFWKQNTESDDHINFPPQSDEMATNGR